MSTNKKIFYGLFGTALVAGGVTSALWVTGTWPFNGGSKLTMKSLPKRRPLVSKKRLTMLFNKVKKSLRNYLRKLTR